MPSASPPPVPPAPPAVEVHGALRAIMHGGATDGRVTLGDVVTPHTIAVGALAGLRGEVTVLDGRIATARADGDGVVAAEGATDARAALLVRADVPAWRDVRLTAAIDADGFDDAIEAALRDAGVDVAAATPFVLDGTFAILDWHVVDGPHTHGEVHGVRRSTPGAAVVVGFFSRHHEGVFTHMGQATHVHVLVAGATGHVDRLAVAPGATLRVPR